MYPASGKTGDSRPPSRPSAPEAVADAANGLADSAAALKPEPAAEQPAAALQAVDPGREPNAEGVVEDPEGEFSREADGAPATGPRIINVGIPGPGAQVAMWRRAWRDKVLLLP